MGSYFISELNRSDSILSATVVTDIAALLLLVSVLIYTSTYRKRGKFEDRLFFAMIILDMVSAVCDALNSVFEQLNAVEQKYSGFIMAGHTVFAVTYTLTLLFFLLYVLTVYGRESKARKYHMLLFVPVVGMGLLLIYNLFSGEIFHVNEVTGGYEYGSLKLAIYFPAYTYGTLSIIMLWKKNNLFMITLIMLIVSRIVLEIVLYTISATPFVLAVLLVFAHICLMNRAFFDEV